MNKRGISAVALVLVVAILLAGAFTWFLTQQANRPSSTEVVDTLPAAPAIDSVADLDLALEAIEQADVDLINDQISQLQDDTELE